jgi:glycosyltransferase involved in cell wall biosynthesis
MILSILIPSIPERSSKLNILLDNLQFQIDEVYKTHPTLGEVEILIDDSKKFIEGGKSVGKKRYDLVEKAKGKYICFLDDDDLPSPNYVEYILRAATYNMDCITFMSIFKCDTYWGLADLDLNNLNEEAKPSIFKRSVWHICPIKKDIAIKEKFDNINNAEDWKWIAKIISNINTSHKINAILHQYNHSKNTSAVDEIEHFNTKSI